MLPSSMARQLAGTMGVQLAHIKQDLGRYGATACAFAVKGRGIRMPADLAAWLKEKGLPADLKSPKQVRRVYEACHGRFGAGLKTAVVAEMARLDFSVAQEGLYSLARHGLVTGEIVFGPKGRAKLWREVQ